MAPMGKMLILTGIVLVVIGLGMIFGSKIPWLGRMPGDINVQKGNFSFQFPIVTCIVLSVLLTIIMNLFFRR